MLVHALRAPFRTGADGGASNLSASRAACCGVDGRGHGDLFGERVAVGPVRRIVGDPRRVMLRLASRMSPASQCSTWRAGAASRAGAMTAESRAFEHRGEARRNTFRFGAGRCEGRRRGRIADSAREARGLHRRRQLAGGGLRRTERTVRCAIRLCARFSRCGHSSARWTKHGTSVRGIDSTSRHRSTQSRSYGLLRRPPPQHGRTRSTGYELAAANVRAPARALEAVPDAAPVRAVPNASNTETARPVVGALAAARGGSAIDERAESAFFQVDRQSFIGWDLEAGALDTPPNPPWRAQRLYEAPAAPRNRVEEVPSSGRS